MVNKNLFFNDCLLSRELILNNINSSEMSYSLINFFMPLLIMELNTRKKSGNYNKSR